MNSDSPSILVLSPNTFNYLSGTGVTFSHLFASWPKDRLANLHSNSEPQDTGVCNRFFRMGPQELHRFFFAPQKQPESNAAGTPGAGPLSWKKKLAGNSGWPETFHLSDELAAWLSTVRPQIIYTVLGPIPIMEAALEIRERFG